MAEIPLGGVAAAGRSAAVDDADYEALAVFGWHVTSNGYVARGDCTGSKQRLILMHRQLLRLEPGDGWTVDHVNHDPLDNRRVNLRRCTVSENGQNRATGYGKYSRHRGVSWSSASGKWRAYAQVNGCMVHLGLFTGEGSAADAAASFRREHMPFAKEAA